MNACMSMTESTNMKKLVKMIIDDYSISPKNRQILLHWGFELVENDLYFYSYKN